MVKLAIAAIVAVVFLGNPQVLSAVSDGVSKIFVSEMVAPGPSADACQDEAPQEASTTTSARSRTNR